MPSIGGCDYFFQFIILFINITNLNYFLIHLMKFFTFDAWTVYSMKKNLGPHWVVLYKVSWSFQMRYLFRHFHRPPGYRKQEAFNCYVQISKASNACVIMTHEGIMPKIQNPAILLVGWLIAASHGYKFEKKLKLPFFLNKIEKRITNRIDMYRYFRQAVQFKLTLAGRPNSSSITTIWYYHVILNCR